MRSFVTIFGGVLTLMLGLLLSACRNEWVSDDPALSVRFSTDTLCFDTVFSGIGSATLQVRLYNDHPYAVRLDDITLDSARYFSLNIDGETQFENLHGLELRGGDSLFIFVRANVDTRQANPVLIEDRLRVRVNGNQATLVLQAYGQDVVLIRSDRRLTQVRNPLTLTAEKPYLIYDTLLCISDLTIEPGAQLYMHDRSAIITYRSLEALGTLDRPIRIMGDRRDYLFQNVPYSYAAGQWGGIYLIEGKSAPEHNTYHLEYVDILSANVGLYIESAQTDTLPTLVLNACRIHNHSVYGLVAIHAHSIISNTEISNAASYCLYLEGGTHRLYHNTIASYFHSTNMPIQQVDRQDVAAIYVHNLYKSNPPTRLDLYNCVVSGIRSNQITVATPFEKYYPGVFVGNLLKNDTLHLPHAHDNVYESEQDTVFRNTYFKYQVYDYYDFRLDSVSPAIGIGDSAVAACFPYDRNGLPRPAIGADAGCYQHQPAE